MNKIIGLIAAFILSASFSAVYAACEDLYIEDISSADNVITTLDDDTEWQVDVSDVVNSDTWQISDDVLVCDDGYIINKEDGEKISAEELNENYE